MAHKTIKSVIAVVIVLVMMLSTLPLSVFATIPNWEENNVVFDGTSFGTNGYYNVISKKDYVLVPGAAVESEMVINNAAGTRRQVLHIIEVDPSNPDVSIVPGYKQIDKLAEDPMNEANWGHQELTEMAKYYENNLGYNIVGGMNTDLYYNSYSPRVLVYNGKNIGNFGKDVSSDGSAFKNTSSILYVFKDAEGNISCDVKAFNKTEFDSYLADGTLLHAVGVSFAMVVKDGKLVNTTEKRGNDDAARSMVGVKEDGTLVICMNDGRGANNSVGFSSYEEGEAMLALGCKWAANCDGGGSSTFISKRVGEENFEMRSVPCDGAQRPTAHGIFVASNVAPTGILNNVNVESDYDIFAPNTVYNFGAEAIDTHGYAMKMPADASWALSNNSFGTIANGEFVSNGTKGTVDIQVLSNGAVVGSKTIIVADPEVFKLSATSTVVPYSTPEKVRTISLPIVAMTGEANVYVDTNAVSVALSDENAGILDGFKFTATEDTSIAGVNVSIAYGDIKLTYAIEFGKGSEIIFDFEDGDKAGFMGFEEAKKWSQDNGVNNTLVGADPLASQFNAYLSSDTFISTTENGGEVRNGNNALAWRLDNTDASFAGWSYNVLFNVGETIVLRDVANGMKATTLGMWLYIPENAFPSASAGDYSIGKGLAFQSQLYVKNADGSYSCKQDHFMFTSAATGKQTNLNSATNADIPESRWVYATIDISKYDYLCTPVATDEGNSRSPSFIRTYVKPDTADIVTFYIDDITLDYSSAVDDRVLPTITNPTYSTSDVAVALNNGTVINGNKIAFSATAADNAALDITSGKIFIDGVEVSPAVDSRGISTAADAILAAGVHTVTFEIKDELGNPARLTRTFTVAGDAAVELGGHNDSGETPKAQSIYYVDINVADLANVNKLVAVLKLNNANTWETKGAIVANGFKATFDYNEISELLTVTVERNGVSGKALNNTLVNIPVRVWTFDRYSYVNNTYYPVSEMGNKPVVNVDVEVVYGVVDGNSFAGSINVATELTTISSPYHEHDAELTVLNKEATTTEIGYENRTYCETCKSVVDWGTIIPKIEITHNYEIVDGKFVCTDEGCGDVYASGTGIFEMNGKLYYSINGILKTGWQDAADGYCYANTSNYELRIGESSIGGVTYVFGNDGVLTSGAWHVTSNGTRYSYGPGYYTRTWLELDGKTYYFGSDAYMYTGIRYVKDNPDTPAYWYIFAEDGSTDKNARPADGLYEVNGDHYIVKSGITGVGIHYIDGYYYLGGMGSGFDRYGYISKNATIAISSAISNGLIPSGTYTFGADGKMVINTGVIGDYLYDENGFMVHAYKLAKVNGDYYFVNDGHKVTKNKEVYIVAEFLEGTTFKPGYYRFDANGKMIINNGANADGFFYIDGVKQLAYQLIEFEGSYYFINDFHKYAVNKTIYLTEQFLEGTNFKPGYYEFGADGKMIIKNGALPDGFFYLNGVKQKAYQLIEFEGSYYFINDFHKYAVNKTIYLTEQFLEGTNFKPGYYEFGADGKMIIKNGALSDGFFYLNGVKQLAYQLIEYNGDYYFISDYHKYVAGKREYLTAQLLVGTNLKPGYYEFDANGKMIIK